MFTVKNILAFLTIGTLGALGHFVYEWSGNNYILGFFFPVNESCWEHLKLLFLPTLIYSAVEFFILGNHYKNYLSATVISLLCGMFSIVAIFYIYRGILGKNIDAINIIIYFVSIIIMLCKKTHLLKTEKFSNSIFSVISVFVIILIGVLFAVWSYNPPALGIFRLPEISWNFLTISWEVI